MTLEFKKVIREAFAGVTHNTDSKSLSTETELKAECETERHNDTNLQQSFSEQESKKIFKKEIRRTGKSQKRASNKLYERNNVLKGDLHSNSPASSCNNTEQVPEWDKIFKNILGDNTAEHDTSSQNQAVTSQEHISTPQKHKSALKTRCSVKKTSAYSRCTVKKASAYHHKSNEEERVSELIALSRSFKLDDPTQHHINEYDGLGVNIFKSCDYKSIFSRSVSDTVSNVKSVNNSYNHCSKPFEPYTHLTGFIAVKPSLQENRENFDCIPDSEVWDEDFFF